jgi:hypothetical protein
MRHRSLLTIVLLAAGLAMVGVAAAHEGEPAFEIPLGKTKLTMGKEKVKFTGKWIGGELPVDPSANTSALQVTGCGGTDTGEILLDPAMWSALKRGKGYVYKDKTGSVAGIRQIAIKGTKKGGKVKVKGKGSPMWNVEGQAEQVLVTLTIADDKWCAVMDQVKNKKGKVRAAGKVFPDACPSTWTAVLDLFERNGCQNDACHGASMQGGLDLRPDVAYANLVNVYSDAGQKKRVQPGSRQDSFLWEKLAAATEGYDLGGRGSPMPSGGQPISADELELVRLWIQYGANDFGVVKGTESLVGSCLPDPDPPTIEAPDPPPADQGVQLHIKPWTVPPATPEGPNGESEVCYSQWYDFSNEVPADAKIPCPDFWGGPDRDCLAYNKTELTQTPNSHHSILHIYNGTYEPTDPGFKFHCQSGAQQGAACDPREATACGGDPEVCYGDVVRAVACIGYGPPDYQFGGIGNPTSSDTAPTVGGSQQPYLQSITPPGVYGVIPVSGIFVTNSHAFNLFGVPETNEQWWNVWFAPQEDRQYPLQAIFDSNDIFVQNVPPFEEREYCRTTTMPKGSHVFELSSHMHQRGRLFRIWGPPIAEACSSGSGGTCLPESKAPIAVTTEYNDPAVLRLVGDDVQVLDSDDPAERRYKFCAVYDNGFSDPALVKRNSTSPNSFLGGKCYIPGARDWGIACLDGPHQGELCAGDDGVCDSSPGAGDGVCDACPLHGGVTTEDEMFILIGSYYCEPGSDCDRGVCMTGPNVGMPCDGNDAVCGGFPNRCGPYTN